MIMKQAWEYKKLGVCFSYIKNGANIKQERNASGLPITRIETLSNGVFNRDRLGYADIFDVGKYEAYVLNDQDILMSHINSKQYIGRAVVYNKEGEETIIHGMNLLRLIAIKEVISPSYISYYFSSFKFKSDIAKIRKDAVNQSSFAISDLKEILIPVATLDEQNQIVSELNHLQSVIDRQKVQLAELENLVQSIFYDMFGDPVANEMNWRLSNVGSESVDMKYGTSLPACEDGKYKYLRMGNITMSGHLDLSDLKFINVPDNDIEKCIVRKGDILFNRTNSHDLIGKTCMFDLEEPMIIAGYIIRVRLSANILPVFFSIMFNLPSYKKLLRSIAKGAVNQANINSKELSSIIIPVPPLSLQQSFTEKIEEIEAMKAKIRQSLEESENLFNSRMAFYFS